MAAPAGVNEESPQEPVKAGSAPVELTEAPAAESESAETVLAEAVPPPAEPAEGELAAAAPETELAEAGPSEAEPAEVEAADAGGPGPDAEHERRDVSPLAVAGIILGILALVGVAVGVLAVVTHGFRPKTVVTVTYRPPAVFGLRPGQCVNSGSDALKVVVVSCAQPHDAEVFAAFTLPAAAWPGTSAVQQDAGNGCASRLTGYLNPQLATAALSQEYVYPNQAAWQADERTVVCEVRAVSGQLTGSVRA